jgi:ubiquinone/menaquinone biosynthesis C-methylase UbiE
MKTEWDYSELAKPYLKRPDYAESVIDAILERVGKGDRKACDVGAGVGHLTLPLAKRGIEVIAVEPNDSMRELGSERLREFANVSWYEGCGEDTGQSDNTFDLVTFGSSFNVVDRTKALQETRRIGRDGGWFACMWNHRVLSDPLQAEIEKIITDAVPEYGYGTRREDQTEVLESSGLFSNVEKLEGSVIHEQSLEDCVEAWRSHGTLQRQAGEKFTQIIDDIEQLLRSKNQKYFQIPYLTRVWIGKLR